MQNRKSPSFTRRKSIQARIRNLARETHKPSQSITILLAMERFSYRLHQIFPDYTVIKGGLALELRSRAARTTQDIDIRTKGSFSEIKELLKQLESFKPVPEDYFEFSIREDPSKPNITGIGVKYHGFRFKVEAKMAGEIFASFGLDISINDPIYGEILIVEGDNFFSKYAIPPIQARVYPPGTHLAEKLHAYTSPMEGDWENSRCKDLVDILLLARELHGETSSNIYNAFQLTFSYRDTHPIPSALPTYPKDWKDRYLTIKQNNDLPWENIEDVFEKASLFLNPILSQKDDL